MLKQSLANKPLSKQHWSARTIDFTTLYQNLQIEVLRETVTEVQKKDLSLFCYTNRCVYHRLWNEWNILARGLILERSKKRVIATPFPKFFNYGELSQNLPDEPFEVYEKLDGSLGIAYYYQDDWHIATKGAFDSEQARWGTKQIHSLDYTYLTPGATYLFELIYPANQIVVKYPFSGLVLLGAYNAEGSELGYDSLSNLAQKLTIKLVQRYEHDSIESILKQAEQLGRESEGFVLRFHSGYCLRQKYRLKIKGSEYCRLHKLSTLRAALTTTKVTPLGIWECLKNGDDLECFRKEIPEEYWADFNQIYHLLVDQFNQLITEINSYHQQYLNLSDKELGLILNNLPTLAKKFIFSCRKGGASWFKNKQVEDKLYEFIKPSSNYLKGYSASQTISNLDQG